MSAVTLSPKFSFSVPVYAPCISPDAFAGKTKDEISRLEVWEGKFRRSLGDLFRIDGEPAASPEETRVRLVGDFRKVRKVGFGMTAGGIVVEGSIGMHLGERMAGGSIRVHGDAGPWLGSGMRGGVIEVDGNAGDYVASAYRGSRGGMSGGTIIIHGNAGSDLGNWMRGGLIRVDGDVGTYVGVRMRGGTILVRGNAGERAGALMLRGKIVICGSIPSTLPSFSIQELRRSVKVAGEVVEGPFYLFQGDLTEGGEGRLFISKPSNPHLAYYERYL